MSGYSDTSLAAYRKVDITAGQRRILDWFERNPGKSATRQQLVEYVHAPINVITGRCAELLDAGVLESLPAVEGRHPLRLKNAAPQARNCDASLTPVVAATGLVAVVPFTGYQPPMSLNTAKRLVDSGDKVNFFWDAAVKRLESV